MSIDRDGFGLKQRERLSVLNIVIATPEARGGAVRAGLQLGDHLKEYVSATTVKMRGVHDELLIKDLDVTSSISQIPSKTLLRDVFNQFIGTKYNYSNTLIWTRLSPPRALTSYDIAHIHNAVPLAGMISVALSCRRASVPYCVTTHGINKLPELPKSMEMSPLMEHVFRLGFLRPYYWVLKNAEHLFALSREDARTLRRRFPKQSICVLPNGVEPNPPAKGFSEDVAARTSISPSDRVLLFVGKLMASKGVDDLLAAYEQLDCDAKLVIVGHVQEEDYVDRIEQIEGAEYFGYTEQSLLDALYRRADIFVFPTRSDVFPLVILEAMAAGTPVVSTYVGGIPEQITDETGILVSPHSPDKITASVNRLLGDDELRTAMGERALDRIHDSFSWENVAGKTAAEYERICRDTGEAANEEIRSQ